ncbi:MAG: thioredoxin family protein [Methanotrichaceae archaeon]|nr:thioredoxin family protein [Methanotrichaceae archaeon]
MDIFKGIFKRTIFATPIITALFLIFSINASSAAAQYSVGSNDDDWWTVYPDQSTGAGMHVNHPDWVLDVLKEKPVLIYVHKDCSYCKPQTEAVRNVVDEVKSQISFYDLGADGSDSRSEDALATYDPNGNVTYVPMTVIVTLAPNSAGEVGPVWHSSEDITGEGWVRDYIGDSISKYDENSANWKR